MNEKNFIQITKHLFIEKFSTSRVYYNHEWFLLISTATSSVTGDKKKQVGKIHNVKIQRFLHEENRKQFCQVSS